MHGLIRYCNPKDPILRKFSFFSPSLSLSLQIAVVSPQTRKHNIIIYIYIHNIIYIFIYIILYIIYIYILNLDEMFVEQIESVKRGHYGIVGICKLSMP